ncbi:PDZ domain-containing protein [Paenibacillus thailandensis]|uniref:PDZ domain-containing protein n=1 Tax=Paenibacillus thailandensis TaxID=393250 RepID=A0ABW5QZN8_9BACL
MTAISRSRAFYTAGIIVAFAWIVIAELIWIPDPIRLSGGAEWIDMINVLFYGIALVPLLWLTGGIYGFAAGESFWRKLVSAASLLLNAAAAVLLFAEPERLLPIGCLIAAAWLVAFADMAAAESAAPRSFTGLSRRSLPKRTVIIFAATVMLLAFFFWPTPYRVTYPGLTMQMNRYAQAETGKPHGDINGVLVFERPAFPVDWLYAALLPHYEFTRISADEPPLTEQYTQVLEMKTDANAIAEAIAMQRAGIGKGVAVDGVKVAAIVAGGPADKLLQAGDVLKQVNGSDVSDINGLTGLMTNVRPGDEVSVTIDRGGKTIRMQVGTRAADDDPGRAVFGISVQNDIRPDTPIAVDYRRYIAHIGGPSHGAMLTLALLDQLTPGGVTNGIRVAGTGTIEADGSVGPVGGVPQKAYAVSRTDADVFFVPASEAEDARQGAGSSLNIVPVKTFDDILNWLKTHGKGQ